MAGNISINALRQHSAFAKQKQQHMNDKTATPMTAEEFISNNYSYSKEPLAWRLFKCSVASLMNDYANYRLAFEKEQQQSWIPTDEEWKQFPDAKWAAMDRDGWVFMHPDNPTCRTRFWIFGNGSCIPLKQVSPVNMDWTKCKVERPEEV